MVKRENALQYVIELSEHTQDGVAYLLKEDGKPLDRSNITKYCKRERKIKKEIYIEKLENLLKIPREYWLGKDGYTKVLTLEVKKEIDEYFRDKRDKRDMLVYKNVGYHPLEKELVMRDTYILMDTVNGTVKEIVYGVGNEYVDEYTIWQRASALLEIVEEVKRIGVCNMKEWVNNLKNYQPYKAMTLEEIEEYESLFGKIEEENTSE